MLIAARKFGMLATFCMPPSGLRLLKPLGPILPTLRPLIPFIPFIRLCAGDTGVLAELCALNQTPLKLLHVFPCNTSFFAVMP